MKGFKFKGQATIEFILSVGILLAIYLSVYRVLIPAVNSSTISLIEARKNIWSRVMDVEKTKLSGEYRLNQHTEKLFIPLNKLLPVNLQGNNLRELKKLDKKVFYSMSRLTDSWQAKSVDELSTRPTSLVVNHLLSGEIIELIQNGIGSLFLTKELSPDYLVFGTISPDVVPEEVLHKKE
ncbi:hypothetical protein [Idiomarina sp. 28-8]|uniref:hypothetical protein n=1 Tax=Idiomarina sp. 28-8 TaxID=1260624 RepID=UPI001F3771D4|nr:hypothetical protein [Idiomarina sp. 28-8]